MFDIFKKKEKEVYSESLQIGRNFIKVSASQADWGKVREERRVFWHDVVVDLDQISYFYIEKANIEIEAWCSEKTVSVVTLVLNNNNRKIHARLTTCVAEALSKHTGINIVDSEQQQQEKKNV